MTSANRPSPATKPTIAHNERDDGHVACVDAWFEAGLADALTVALSDRTGLPAGTRLPRTTGSQGRSYVVPGPIAGACGRTGNR